MTSPSESRRIAAILSCRGQTRIGVIIGAINATRQEETERA
jgi:hypothetical protein